MAGMSAMTTMTAMAASGVTGTGWSVSGALTFLGVWAVRDRKIWQSQRSEPVTTARPRER